MDYSFSFLIARGLTSDLAKKITLRYPNWEEFNKSTEYDLREYFNENEIKLIKKAKLRRGISVETVNRLVNECEFRCCICWNIDLDDGVVIHHIRSHASSLDDSYENLVVLCPDHHSKVHTKWELARNPYPPEYLIYRKAEFIAAISDFKLGKRPAPGREEKVELGFMSILPRPPTHFCGRDDNLKEIASNLMSPSARIAIIGMGGVGKTALALKVCYDLAPSFPGGALWAEMPQSLIGLSEIMRKWLRSLGHDSNAAEITEIIDVFAAIVEKHVSKMGAMLLFIDDISDVVLNSIKRLSSILSSQVSLLVTTRDLACGVALGANIVQLESLDRGFSLKLLESISGRAWGTEYPDVADSILSQIGNLPLAIELVAKQIVMQSRKPNFELETLNRRLASFDDQLLSFAGHRGVARTFALSYENLDEDGRRLFRFLGIFSPGPFCKGDVAAMIYESPADTEILMDALVTVSMLNWTDCPGKYRLHSLLHKYANFELCRSDSNEQSIVRRRFYQHYSKLAINASYKHAEGFFDLERIFSNLINAMRVAFNDGQHLLVVNTVRAVATETDFVRLRNVDSESIPLFDIAINATQSCGDLSWNGVFLGHLGTSYARLGVTDKAIDKFKMAIDIAKSTSNDYDLASHMQNLAVVLLDNRKTASEAEILLQKGLKIAERAMNHDAALGCLTTLGNYYRGIGDLNKSITFYHKALNVSQIINNRFSEGNNLSNIGLIKIDLGDLDEAENLISRAMAIATEIGDIRGRANRAGHLGRILIEKVQRLKPSSKSLEMLYDAYNKTADALIIARKTGDAKKSACWLMNLANILRMVGRSSESIALYREAVAIAHLHGFLDLEAQIHFNLGITLEGQADTGQAIDHIVKASDILQQINSPMARQAINMLEELRGKDK